MVDSGSITGSGKNLASSSTTSRAIATSSTPKFSSKKSSPNNTNSLSKLRSKLHKASLRKGNRAKRVQLTNTEHIEVGKMLSSRTPIMQFEFAQTDVISTWGGRRIYSVCLGGPPTRQRNRDRLNGGSGKHGGQWKNNRREYGASWFSRLMLMLLGTAANETERLWNFWIQFICNIVYILNIVFWCTWNREIYTYLIADVYHIFIFIFLKSIQSFLILVDWYMIL